MSPSGRKAMYIRYMRAKTKCVEWKECVSDRPRREARPASNVANGHAKPTVEWGRGEWGMPCCPPGFQSPKSETH